MKTILISAFPGTGKSHLFRTSKKKVLDSDSSTFDKKDFPRNYIEHIKNNIGKVDIILISSHKDVRDALVKEGLFFYLVFPNINLKEEYLNRYKERGSPEKFIELISNNWESWIKELQEQRNCVHYELQSGEFISDLNLN